VTLLRYQPLSRVQDTWRVITGGSVPDAT
jgi:hypothetical protein